MKKRLFSIFLALSLVLSLLPTATLAYEVSEDANNESAESAESLHDAEPMEESDQQNNEETQSSAPLTPDTTPVESGSAENESTENITPKNEEEISVQVTTEDRADVDAAGLQAQIDAAAEGATIQLTGNVVLADDTPLMISNKGTEDNPITLDLNGFTISGSNRNGGFSGTSTSPGGILFVTGSHVILKDSSGKKGGIINTLSATNKAYGIVLASSAKSTTSLLVRDGVRIEVPSASSNFSAALKVDVIKSTGQATAMRVENAAVKSCGYVYAGDDDSQLTCTIDGGTFERLGNKDAAISTPKRLTINGGTFTNMRFTSIELGAVAEGKAALYRKDSDGKMTVTVADTPTEYAARISSAPSTVSGYCKAYVPTGGDLGILFEAGIVSASQTTITVASSMACTYSAEKPFGKDYSDDASGNELTLDLAEGAVLSGGLNLYTTDVKVTGAGTLAEDFSWNPADGFTMTKLGEDGVYSCRLTEQGSVAVLIKADGSKNYI